MSDGRQLTEGNTLAEGSSVFGLSRERAGVLLMANLIIYFELWQRKEENRCASGAKTLEIFWKTLEVFRQTSEFWGVMAEKTLHRRGSGGKIGGKVCPLWCSLRLHLVQPSPPSGAAFTPL